MSWYIHRPFSPGVFMIARLNVAKVCLAGVLAAVVTGCASGGLFEDRFDSYNPQWRQVRGQWAVQNGEAVQVRDEAVEQNTIFFYDPLSIADAEITTIVSMNPRTAQFTTGADAQKFEELRRIAGAGIVFRYQNENNFYMFRIAGEEGLVLGKMQDGQWRDLANPRVTEFGANRIQYNTPYTLRVRAQGPRLQGFINDRAVVSLDDASFSTGRVGLVTFHVQASFASIRVDGR
jgi:hypothetical protein